MADGAARESLCIQCVVPCSSPDRHAMVRLGGQSKRGVEQGIREIDTILSATPSSLPAAILPSVTQCEQWQCVKAKNLTTKYAHDHRSTDMFHEHSSSHPLCAHPCCQRTKAVGAKGP
jgi:hypothetical protein